MCSYKIKYLEGIDAFYHAKQLDKLQNVDDSLEEYASAKGRFQDALDIINGPNGIKTSPTDRDRKYWDFINNDKKTLTNYLTQVDSNVTRIIKNIYQ